MVLPVRWRLTLWFGGTLALVLLVFSAVVYSVMRHDLLRRTDRALFDELAEVEDEVKSAHNRSILVSQLRRRFGDDASNDYQVSLKDHEIVFRSNRLGDHRLPFPEVPLVVGDEQAATISLQGKSWRAASRLVTGPLGVTLLQVAVSLMGVEAALNELLEILLIVGPLVMLGALGGGYLLARRALLPVDQMTITAAEITARRLTKRLVVGNPGDELGRLATTLNDMLDRLARSLEEMQRFTADAAHELRTPLALIRNEVEVALQGKEIPESDQSAWSNVIEETDRLSRLVEQLLFLCREDTGMQTTRFTIVHLESLVHNVAEHMQPVAAEKGVALLSNLEAVTCLGDSDQLRRLVLNLLDNGIKFTNDGGSVCVSLKRNGERATLSVKDTGIGIPPEHVSHIFRRFYQVSAARSGEEAGTGLGLAICCSIVESHGGSVQVASVEGVGTEMTVELPTPGASA